MCDGGVFSVPLITAAIGVGTAVYGQNQQIKANNEMAARQQEEINAHAQQKTHDRMQEARALRAQSRAAAAEAGVAGNSLGIFLDDIMGQAGQDVAIIESNRRKGVQGSDAQNRAQNRGASAETLGGVTSSVIGGATGAYSNYQKYKIGDG